MSEHPQPATERADRLPCTEVARQLCSEAAKARFDRVAAAALERRLAS